MRYLERVVAPLMFVFTALGCETSADTSSLPSASAITSILVDPSFFMGDMPCTATPGSMQSYVAQIYDVTNADEIITLSASPPVSCAAAVTFRQVVVGHLYRIKIDGYDIAARNLLPVGGASSGSQTMLLKTNPDAGPVEPQWSTHCEDVAAVENTRVSAADCTPFSNPPQASGILVDPRVAMKSAQPALTCDDVFALHVRPDNQSLPALVDLPCNEGGAPPPAFTQFITAGQTYRFRIEATATDGGPVVWGSSCFATAVEGLVVDAACDPLRADGAMEVMITAEECAEKGAVTYDVDYPGPPKETLTQVPCGKSVRFSPLAPGMHAVAIVAHRATGDIALEGSCSAEVKPGAVTLATCTAL